MSNGSVKDQWRKKVLSPLFLFLTFWTISWRRQKKYLISAALMSEWQKVKEQCITGGFIIVCLKDVKVANSCSFTTIIPSCRIHQWILSQLYEVIFISSLNSHWNAWEQFILTASRKELLNHRDSNISSKSLQYILFTCSSTVFHPHVLRWTWVQESTHNALHKYLNPVKFALSFLFTYITLFYN